MSKRAIHYDDWDGGTEADQDHPEDLYCGTECGDPLMSTYRNDVTCKRCLKILAVGKADRALEDQKYKAELYDEVWQKARDMGFANVTMALSKLEALPQGEPVAFTAVGVLRDDGDGGLAPEWILEGGTAELWDGAMLLIAEEDQELCAEDGHCELYREQPAPVAVVLPPRMNEDDAVHRLLGRFGVYGVVPADVATDIYNAALADVAALNGGQS